MPPRPTPLALPSLGDTAFATVSQNGDDDVLTIVVLVSFTILGTLVMTK